VGLAVRPRLAGVAKATRWQAMGSSRNASLVNVNIWSPKSGLTRSFTPTGGLDGNGHSTINDPGTSLSNIIAQAYSQGWGTWRIFMRGPDGSKNYTTPVQAVVRWSNAVGKWDRIEFNPTTNQIRAGLYGATNEDSAMGPLYIEDGANLGYPGWDVVYLFSADRQPITDGYGPSAATYYFYPAYASVLGGPSVATLTGGIQLGNVEHWPGVGIARARTLPITFNTSTAGVGTPKDSGVRDEVSLGVTGLPLHYNYPQHYAGSSLAVTFLWDAVRYPTNKIEIQVSERADFPAALSGVAILADFVAFVDQAPLTLGPVHFWTVSRFKKGGGASVNLVANKSYYVRIRAERATGGWTGWSEVGSGKTPPRDINAFARVAGLRASFPRLQVPLATITPAGVDFDPGVLMPEPQDAP